MGRSAYQSKSLMQFSALLLLQRIFSGFCAMTTYVCLICGHVYNPEKGEPIQNIPPNTAFSALPADWVCPVCGAEKKLFKEE
ncbi:MAG TPA: rubredoxin [Methanoregula sp.]|nr:rubredoxin [Methanoregula sp.]